MIDVASWPIREAPAFCRRGQLVIDVTGWPIREGHSAFCRRGQLVIDVTGWPIRERFLDGGC